MTIPPSAGVRPAVVRACRPRTRRAGRPWDNRRACPERSRKGAATLSRTFLTIGCLLAFASAIPAAAVDFQRGAVVRVAQIYLSPDTSSAKLAEMDRGREIIVLETSREWVHVEANLTEQRTVTGWVLDKGVVRASTPNGDKILFGEAVDSEDQASRRRGRKG